MESQNLSVSNAILNWQKINSYLGDRERGREREESVFASRYQVRVHHGKCETAQFGGFLNWAVVVIFRC